MESKKITGYPSIDKPWLKYYSGEQSVIYKPEENLYEYIYENNKDYLNDIALDYFGKRISYGELFHKIDQAENAFASLGVLPGDVVSCISITTPELIYSIYALNKIGAVINMLDPRSSADTLVRQISKAESKVLIILDECIGLLDSIVPNTTIENIVLISVKQSMGFPVKQLYTLKKVVADKKQKQITKLDIIKWHEFISKRKVLKKDNNIEALAQHPALIEYTGGTTGDSKGVLLSNKNINSVVKQYRQSVTGFDRGQTWLTVSAPFIAYAFVVGLHMPLSYGMQCVIEPYDPEEIAKKIVKKKYNHIKVTPIIWEKIIRLKEAQKKDFSFLIAPTSGADHMSNKLEQDINNFLFAHGCTWKICQGYGMTEVSSGVSVCISNKCYKLGSVGIPMLDTVISAFDVDTGKECRIGETGEICISGPSVMLEYYKDSDSTKAVLFNDDKGVEWLHTGDLWHIDEDGCLFIDGRIKRMIIRNDGFKVFPSVVEEKLLTHDLVANCAVVGERDARSEVGMLPVAVIVLTNPECTNETQIVKDLQDICNQSLPEYARPIRFIFEKSLPVTAAGKIDYRLLEKKV